MMMNSMDEMIELMRRNLEGVAGDEEKQRLEERVRHDDALQQLLEEELEAAPAAMDEALKQSLYRRIAAKIDPGQRLPELRAARTASVRSLQRSNLLRWSAILLLPLLSAYLTWTFTRPADLQDSPVTIATGYGEKAEVTLPDGSRVWINSGSRLTYDSRFNRKRRDLQLTGEAYFEVVPNSRKPFVVQTADLEVEALGTSFSVTDYDDESFATSVLLEGKVHVRAGEQERFLTDNHRATLYKASHTLATDAVRAADFMVWKDGYLYFENCSFDEIARRLSRMFNVEIRFHSEKLKTLHFTGTLGNSSIRNVLDILSLTSPMRYEMSGTTVALHYEP